jgi:uncharacterized protein (TIRG00374 family)
MKRLIALSVSFGIMVFIFSQVDFAEFISQVRSLHAPSFFLALTLFIPQILLSAIRWKFMIRKKAFITLLESTQLILAASSLNLLLPSKMGDLSKGYFLKNKGKMDLKRGTNVVIFERYIDLVALGVLALTGIIVTGEWGYSSLVMTLFAILILGGFLLILLIQKGGLPVLEKFKLGRKIQSFLVDTGDYLAELKKKSLDLLWVILMSLFLWFLHLLQFYCIFLALETGVSLFGVFSQVPLAIIAGLIPMTLAGVGTRDAALIALFSGTVPLASMVFVGLFASFRYLVPGLLGLPFLNRYIVKT